MQKQHKHNLTRFRGVRNKFSSVSNIPHIPIHGIYTVNGTTTQFFPAKNLKSWAVWQNENHSVAAKPQTSQQGATLKSCSNNIEADMAPLL